MNAATATAVTCYVDDNVLDVTIQVTTMINSGAQDNHGYAAGLR